MTLLLSYHNKPHFFGRTNPVKEATNSILYKNLFSEYRISGCRHHIFPVEISIRHRKHQYALDKHNDTP